MGKMLLLYFPLENTTLPSPQRCSRFALGCPLNLPLSPLALLILVASKLLLVQCPFVLTLCSGFETSPQIDTNTLPILFPTIVDIYHPTVPTFYTYKTSTTPIVATYSVRLSNTATIDVGVESSFLLGNLHVEIWTSGSLLATGGNKYNYSINITNICCSYLFLLHQDTLQETVSPGNYEIRIVLPPGQTSTALPQCIPYNFDLAIREVTPTQSVCLGDHLPYSLNTMRYLQSEGDFNYQSGSWIIRASNHTTSFNATQANSYIRVNIEPQQTTIGVYLQTASGTVKNIFLFIHL